MNALPKMILLDFGGTLATENHFDNYRGLREAFEDAGYAVSDILLRRMSDKLSFFFKTFMKFGKEYNIEIPNIKVLRSVILSEGLSFDFDAERFDYMYWTHASHIEAVNGADSLLKYLRKKGIRAAVVSNISFSGKTVQRVLDEIMPDNGIETVFSSSDYVFRKPDKIFFEIVMAQLGIQAENTWICGDNIANDVRGGLNAGLRTVYYCTDPSNRLDDERVTTITALTDLIDMIERADGVRRDENEKAT